MKYELTYNGITIATLEDNGKKVGAINALLQMAQTIAETQEQKLQDENADEIREG